MRERVSEGTACVGLNLFALSLLAAAVLAPVAGAEESSAAVASTFEAEASNGYMLRVDAGPNPDHPVKGEVRLELRHGVSSAEYSAPAKFTATSISANLGKLGVISVNFLPSGSTAQRSICGSSRSFETGVYEGQIEFHGEGGYTNFSAAKVDALLGPWSNFLCIDTSGGRSETWGADTPGARLRVKTRRQLPGSFLEVFKSYRKARVAVYATRSERLGLISIERTVEGWVDPGAFTFDPRLREARLALPAPFSGSARFNRKAARGQRWSGSLSVDFPGRPHVRFTGTGIGAELVHREIR